MLQQASQSGFVAVLFPVISAVDLNSKLAAVRRFTSQHAWGYAILELHARNDDDDAWGIISSKTRQSKCLWFKFDRYRHRERPNW